MPDNLQLNAGSGGLVAATKEVTHGGDLVQLQAVSILGVSGVEGAYVIADINGSAANGLEVDVTRVTGTVTVDGSAVIQPVHDENLISTDNSTVATLGIGATFLGTAEDISQYSAVSVILAASHDSAVDGMQFQFSPDGTNWDETHIFTLTASEEGRHFQFPAHAQWFRVNYTNGGTGQTTFRVQTILHAHNIGTSIHRLVDVVSPDRSATVVKSAIIAQAAGTGNFVPVQASAIGNLKMSIEEINGSVEGGGVEATALRVTMANDSTGLLSVDGSGFTQPISAAALPLPAGAATSAAQLPDGHNVTVDNASLVVDGSGVTQPISAVALPLPAGAATSAGQLADGHNVTVDNGAGGAAVNIQDGGNTITIDGTVTANAGTGDFLSISAHTRNESFKEATSIGGELDDAGTVAATEGNVSPVRITAQRAIHANLRNDAGTEIGTVSDPVIITDDGNAILVDGSGVTQPISAASLPLPTGAATSANQLPDGHAVTVDNGAAGAAVNIQDGGNSITVDAPVATPINAQISDGTDTALVTGAGELNVIATAQPGVDIGDVDVTSISAGANLIGDVGIGVRTSGGTTFYKNLDVDNTEDAVKASAGQLYWIHCINLGSAVNYLKFYDDTVGNVIVGTTVPDLTFPIPTQGDSNGAGFTLSIPNGIAFGTAITVAATTGFADNDSADPGANEVILNLGFA